MAEIDRYSIERELGRGAMGVVYLAHDTELDREVALKELSVASAPTPERRAELVERFEREAKAAGALDSPSIVKVYDTFSDDDRHFIVMEYLDGRTLDEVLQGGPLPPDAALGVITQILGALKTAHDAGIVHRDLKPENVFVLDDGLVKVADFGIARVDDGGGLTQAGQVLGTLGYMSPEQVRGQTVDGRSDLFAVGVMFYEMLVGTNPFAADQPTTIMYRIAYEEPPAIDLIVTGLPPHLGAVIRKATAKEPELRYQSAEEMLADVEGGVAPDTSLIEAAAVARAANAETVTPPAKPTPRLKISRKALISVLIAAVLVLGIAGGAYAYYRDRQAKDAARAEAIRTEAEAMVDRVAEIKGMRVELEGIIKSIDNKAAANKQALAKWDTDWKKRQKTYDSRVSEVDAHNSREQQKRLDSAEEYWDYWSYTYTTVYPYTPQIWSYPDYPKQPSKVKVKLGAEDKALVALQSKVNGFRSTLATESASAQYFSVVYERAADAADALLGTIGDARTVLTDIVVVNDEKGDVVNQAKVGLVDLAALDAPFQAVDQEVSLYTKNYGLSLEDLLAEEASGTPEATKTAGD